MCSTCTSFCIITKPVSSTIHATTGPFRFITGKTKWCTLSSKASSLHGAFVTKSLKREEIYAKRCEDIGHIRVNIEEFIEESYNRQRLHSARGYRSPEEFEQQTEGQAKSRSATMEFFENKENSRKISTELLGKGTQLPSPSPDPFSC